VSLTGAGPLENVTSNNCGEEAFKATPERQVDTGSNTVVSESCQLYQLCFGRLGSDHR